jgi:ketosteroid isomerase-like protein
MDRAFFEGYYRAYNTADESQLAPFLAEDVVLASPEGETKGREAYFQIYRHITAQFIDQMTPESIEIDGDRTVVQIHDRFTARTDVESFLGQSFRKGQVLELKLTGRYLVKDGRIARIEVGPR